MGKKESLLDLAAEGELEAIKTRYINKATISDMEEIIAQTVDVAEYDQYHTNILFHFKAVRTCDIEDAAEHAVQYHHNMMALFLKYIDDEIQEEWHEWIRLQRAERAIGEDDE